MTGQGEHLRWLAAVARDAADRLRTLAGTVSSTRGVSWQSASAEAFRDAAARHALALRRRADELDHAGDLLHAHATGVDDALDHLARVAGLVGGGGQPR
jgi:uncharacterized protein YukE